MRERHNPPVVYAVQGEKNSRKIRFLLFQNGIPFEIDTKCSILISYKKTDGHGGMYDVIENGDKAYEFNGSNSITITLAEQVLTCPGDVYLSVLFVDEEEILSTFTIIVKVDINPGADVAESEDYFSIQAAINAAIQSFDSPVFYVVVSGNDRTGYILVTPGRDIIAAQRSRKVIACSWLDKNVYIPLAKEYSDSDVSFSGVIKGTEYYVRINPIDNNVLNAFMRPVGVGFDNVYIGSDEPTSDSVQLWINPESSNDIPPYIPAPSTASVGQTIVVKTVDEDGKPTEWEAADFPSGIVGENQWRLIRSVTTEEDALASVEISTDSSGAPFALTEVYVRTIAPVTDLSGDTFVYINDVYAMGPSATQYGGIGYVYSNSTIDLIAQCTGIKLTNPSLMSWQSKYSSTPIGSTINKITLKGRGSSAVIPIGTVIEVFGR